VIWRVNWMKVGRAWVMGHRNNVYAHLRVRVPVARDKVSSERYATCMRSHSPRAQSSHYRFLTDTTCAVRARYASEVDVEFVRKAIRAIGRCAIKLDTAADACVEALVQLIDSSQINYVVQEAIVVIRDIFRKYPRKYEGIIVKLCEKLERSRGVRHTREKQLLLGPD